MTDGAYLLHLGFFSLDSVCCFISFVPSLRQLNFRVCLLRARALAAEENAVQCNRGYLEEEHYHHKVPDPGGEGGGEKKLQVAR